MAFETKYPINPAFTTAHVLRSMQRGAGQYLANSVIYALLSGICGTAIAFICAYVTARGRDSLHRLLHLAALTSMSVPGIVLGLSYLIFFHNMPIYGTVFIIVMVNTVHFLASPYLMMYNVLLKMNPNIEDVGTVLGVGKLHVICDVIIPKVRGTLCEMFSYFFVNAMMTISAVAFLSPPAAKPISLMINQFEAQLLMESAAFVSLLIFCVNIAVRILADRGSDILR